MKMQAVSRFTTRSTLLGQGTNGLADWRQVTRVPDRLSSKRSADDYAGQFKYRNTSQECCLQQNLSVLDPP